MARKPKPLPSQEVLLSVLAYDPKTGVLTWIKAPYSVAGSPNGRGYLAVTVFQNRYVAHRLVWKMAYGTDPVEELDHINGNRSDNRLLNLRQATPSQNRQNTRLSIRNSTGMKGVSPHQGKYRAGIMVNGRTLHLGVFDDPVAAHEAYAAAARANYGNFANIARIKGATP